MNIDEFFIRLSMIQGHKLSKIRKLSKLPTHLTMENSIQLLKKIGFNPLQISQFKSPKKIELIAATLKWLEQHPYHHIVNYLDESYPPLLRAINAAPLILFVKGNCDLLKMPQIAMVGSRQHTGYGRYFADYFARSMVTKNLVITSGLALGIDSICHHSVLMAKGKTIAVLASGLTKISPAIHQPLAERIVEDGGALVSEFLPPEIVRSVYFPRRNRIISGLSLATFVIEATQKSGSLITANYALEQNRTIFALPGDLRNKNSYGAHQLIKQGAFLVTEPEDIFSLLKNSTLRRFTKQPTSLNTL